MKTCLRGHHHQKKKKKKRERVRGVGWRELTERERERVSEETGTLIRLPAHCR